MCHGFPEGYGGGVSIEKIFFFEFLLNLKTFCFFQTAATFFSSCAFHVFSFIFGSLILLPYIILEIVNKKQIIYLLKTYERLPCFESLCLASANAGYEANERGKGTFLLNVFS
jgi:hypothetical protein